MCILFYHYGIMFCLQLGFFPQTIENRFLYISTHVCRALSHYSYWLHNIMLRTQVLNNYFWEESSEDAKTSRQKYNETYNLYLASEYLPTR